MAQHSTAPRSNPTSQETSARHRDARSEWAHGGMVFAGVLMMAIGVMSILNGIAGIATDDVYTNIGDYVFKFSLTTWGWIHLVLGLAVLATGWGVMQGRGWARAAGIALTSLFAIEYFMFLPYAPIWSLICIGAAVFVIWSLATSPDSHSRM
ncbi:MULTISPECIES: DUF7144 family membrane protein [Streptomyces]|uniref:DUF7144 domain-containing protein n=1 Tax=Streptomyces stelliscabiei TaxID=146820 RepID=A0A8I0TR63_9ACTN|nr:MULTISPECIES: hypothetical protein [Streptomyces]KND44019.1 membrane protein [Streptomyces stelliscabiei]MBE1598655.1 hypothetical protein [Streptomyces stelliscabiei]MDX2516553.1 hypothetical protein [Streptomyces stelliscabiei]MDX2553565.1 hypothetical protein [Streptomyces stelliscabiei]MDX2613459.1 hypothetical protein [Streptomyces stelliscabiei]